MSNVLPARCSAFRVGNYGLKTGATSSPAAIGGVDDLQRPGGGGAREDSPDALAAGLPDDGKGLDAGGTGATAYAEAVSVYLAFAVDKAGRLQQSLCALESTRRHSARALFGRQAIPMVWDFAEANPFADAAGDFTSSYRLDRQWSFDSAAQPKSDWALQSKPTHRLKIISQDKVVSTDPPYYDNIGYADLSDFFYVWLRRALTPVFPDTLCHHRRSQGRRTGRNALSSRQQGEGRGLLPRRNDQAMQQPRRASSSGIPDHDLLRLQAVGDRERHGTVITGWETFLEAVIRAGLATYRHLADANRT